MPNYDLPNAAPEPLRLVQQFVNTVDRERNREWLPDWLAEHGLPAAAYERASALREALRSLLHVNNAGGTAPDAVRRASAGRISTLRSFSALTNPTSMTGTRRAEYGIHCGFSRP